MDASGKGNDPKSARDLRSTSSFIASTAHVGVNVLLSIPVRGSGPTLFHNVPAREGNDMFIWYQLLPFSLLSFKNRFGQLVVFVNK
jgi:hypothetical protein